MGGVDALHFLSLFDDKDNKFAELSNANLNLAETSAHH